MKRLILSLMAAVVLVGLATTGCKNTSPQAVSYQVAGTTATTVEAALREWNAWVKAGKATVSQEIQVRTAYQKYQAAFAAVCDAGAIYSAYSTTNAAGATGAKAALEQAISNASQSIADVENLIAQFTGGAK